SSSSLCATVGHLWATTGHLRPRPAFPSSYLLRPRLFSLSPPPATSVLLSSVFMFAPPLLPSVWWWLWESGKWCRGQRRMAVVVGVREWRWCRGQRMRMAGLCYCHVFFYVFSFFIFKYCYCCFIFKNICFVYFFCCFFLFSDLKRWVKL
ncbi:hypothetical protein KSS87_022197, partial [Heliosperma pusillum]